MTTTAAANNQEMHAVHRLKRANVWGKLKVRESRFNCPCRGRDFWWSGSRPSVVSPSAAPLRGDEDSEVTRCNTFARTLFEIVYSLLASLFSLFQAKYEAEIFDFLPKEHAAKAIPNGLAREFHDSEDGRIVAGLVREVFQALGMDSTLRVFGPESLTEPLARPDLKVRLLSLARHSSPEHAQALVSCLNNQLKLCDISKLRSVSLHAAGAKIKHLAIGRYDAAPCLPFGTTTTTSEQ
jgi:hypothetical protein